MSAYTTLWSYFLRSSLLIKAIFVILLIASISTWILIVQGLLTLRKLQEAAVRFENEFWSDIKLTALYEELPESIPPEYLSAVFYAGFTEFCRLRDNGCQVLRVLLKGVSRAMQIAQAQASIQLNRPIHWLAIISSSTPYLGLIGTLLGTISALGSVSHAGQPNALLLIAPGIAEALIVSVASLLTALPALIFYHSYLNQSERLLSQYQIFQEEFIALLLRQAYEEKHEDSPSN